MMKQLLFILTSLLAVACTTADPSIRNNIVGLETDSLQQNTFSIDGLWVMSNFTDSILTNKSIAKYRIQHPTNFAILIDINKDTLRAYGLISDLELTVQNNSDSICVFKTNTLVEWILSLNNKSQQLELRPIQHSNSENDYNVLTFNRRPELEFLIENVDGVPKTRTNFTNYFNDQLFSGTYQISGTQDSVKFSKDGTISGLLGYAEFSVDCYFGTLHPFENIDNIVFYKAPLIDSRFRSDRFKWSFKGDTLSLTQFIFETEESKVDGRIFRTGDWQLSREEIVLVRRK